MKYEIFKEQLIATLKEKLNERHEDTSLEVIKTVKMNQTYEGILFPKKNTNVSPCTNINLYYEDYINGRSMEDIIEEILYIPSTVPPKFDTEWIQNFEITKDNIYIKVCGVEQNSEFLDKVPHKQIEDIAIIYYIMLENTDVEVASVTITNDMLNLYGIEKEKLHEIAIKNSLQNEHAIFQNISEFIPELFEGDRKEALECKLYGNNLYIADGEYTSRETMYVLTNSSKRFGASCIFYPRVLESIGEIFKSDFYILPSSTHECIILPVSDLTEINHLIAMVKEVNATMVSADEKLTDSVYFYDCEKKHFKKVA